MDRIDEIKIKPFKIDEKREIVKSFRINDMCNMIGLNRCEYK